MKICVFSTPRTCSTFMCNILSNKFNIDNIGERLYGNFTQQKKQEKLDFLKLKDNYVVKLFSKYFYDSYIELHEFDWNVFDCVVITQRNNLVRQMASLYNIRYPNKDCIDITDEVMDLFNTHKECIQLFYNIRNTLIQDYKNIFVIEYEKLQYSNTESLKYLYDITNIEFTENNLRGMYNKSSIDYKIKYTNYSELELIVNNWKFDVGT